MPMSEPSKTTNYARNVKSGELRFFEHFYPEMFETLENWAFYALPPRAIPSRFRCRLIGESADVRCARLLHAPGDKRCAVCVNNDNVTEN